MNSKKQLLIYYYNWYYSFIEYMLLMLELISSLFIKHVSYCKGQKAGVHSGVVLVIINVDD